MSRTPGLPPALPPEVTSSPGPKPGPAPESDDLADLAAQDIEQRSATVDSRAHGDRLDRWLASMVREFSRNHLQGLIEAGEVTVDGVVASSTSKRVSAGQAICVRLVPPPDEAAFLPEAMPLACVFEDAQLLVIDKPVGLVVHPAPGHWRGTLLNGLLAHHPQAASLARAGIVHRLDKDTSGLMVVGKTLEAVTALGRAIAAREVQRLYLAVVHGVPAAEHFSIDAPIGRDPVSRVKMAVVAGGRAARTDVSRLASTLPVEGGPRYSAVRCRLHTGRTHQIRVHLAHRGHPLLADVLYGGRPELGVTRQALHAEVLAFDHPLTGEPLRFESPLPADLDGVWQQVVGEAASKAARIRTN